MKKVAIVTEANRDNMKTLPKISIVTPVLNGGKTLEKAIKSILEQDYENIELIILDGGSIDNTVEIIKRYESHITYWHSKRDTNATYALNEGIKKATGDLVAFLMCDDWYEPGTFHAIAHAAMENSGADMITCGGRLVSYDSINKCFIPKLIYNTTDQLDLNFYNICFSVSAICCRFIKKSFIDKMGVFMPCDKKGVTLLSYDKEFLLRAVEHHGKNVVINHLGHNYFSHPGSSTFSNNRLNMMRLCHEHMMIAELYLGKKNLTKDQRALLKYWYMRESIYLLFHSLLNRRVPDGFRAVIRGLKKFKLLWIITFMKITIKGIFTRMKRRFHVV